MKTFTMKLFGIGFIVIIMSLGYYFAIFLPNEKAHQNLLVNQDKCLQMEKNITADFDKNWPNDLFSAQNHFNSNLNKCIVKLTNSSSVTILDATEDKSLIACFTTNQKTDCYSGENNKITKDNFDEIEHQYMTE
ncbi:MAG: hypothetical protein WDN09_03920 [bacterium]